MSERTPMWGLLPPDGTILTTAEYLQTAESLRVQELIYGRLHVEDSPHFRHQNLLLELAVLLRVFVGQHKLGTVCIAPQDVILDAAIAGLGVARFTDLTIRVPLQSGQLVPVLADWESKHAPPISMLYRANQRRLPRVRLFVDFLVDLFRKLEAEREPALAVKVEAEGPHRHRRRHGRAPATPREKA